MKESNKTLETLFDKVTKSKLPIWAKTTVVISFALTPLIEVFSRVVLVSQISNLIQKLISP